jgi:hypothetical protein
MGAADNVSGEEQVWVPPSLRPAARGVRTFVSVRLESRITDDASHLMYALRLAMTQPLICPGTDAIASQIAPRVCSGMTLFGTVQVRAC